MGLAFVTGMSEAFVDEPRTVEVIVLKEKLKTCWFALCLLD